jgi:beta-glucosidase
MHAGGRQRPSKPRKTLQAFGAAVAALSMTATGMAAAADAPPAIFTPATTARAQALMGQMTTDEKIGQLTQLFVFQKSEAVDERIRTGGMGSALFVTDPTEINRLQHLAVDNTRLHIPLIFGFDVIHGFRTIFPAPLAMAASWDPSGAEREETIAAAEARSVGIHWAFAPMIDIARDPRWGRIVEGAGEDPYLGSAMARAHVRGFQGPAIGTPDHVLACAKHFAGYGAAEGGRDYDASYISDAQMQNVYLPPFHAAVEAGVGSLMSAYMDLNDVPATGNKFLLTDTLRTEWGFQGFVVSDADAVKSLEKHGFAADAEDAGVRALTAGVNMEMALMDPAYGHLKDALAANKVTMAQIDAAVLPILEAKIQLGLFEHPFVDVLRSERVLADPAHRKEARLLAQRSAVLLRNEGSLLPLSKTSYKSIAIIGPTGTDPMDMTGSWTFVQDNKETVTIEAGLREKLGSGVSVSYAPGVQIERHFPSFFDQISRVQRPAPWSAEEANTQFDKAVALAKSSDLVLLTLGEHQQMSGEAASRSSLELPGDQQKLMEAVMALGKPTVLVLSNGRPLNISWAAEHVPAILDIWYPGTQGGAAVADLLFGDAVPGGHLPIAWPRNVGQIPINYAHNLTQDSSKQGERYWNEPSTPLFPFGYGLSYSKFSFQNLQVDQESSPTGSELNVTAEVTNTGSAAADEVAQLYIHQRAGRSSRPVRELKGFERIHLMPGAHRTVHFKLGPAELRYWSAADHSWGEDAAAFDVWVGADSTATLHNSFTRTAAK